jgi:putative membrane protein
MDDVLNMLALVLPDPGTADPLRVFDQGVNGLDSDAGFVTTPRRARLLAPLGWRRNAFAATDTALLMRSGRWWRQLVVVPHQRTQSIAMQQGPLARRFGLADLVLHTTAGPVAPRVIQADIREAQALFDAQAARARAARRRQTSEQWLAQVAPALTPVVDPAPVVEPVPHPTPAPQQEGQQRG